MITPAVRTEVIKPGDTFVMCTDGLWEPVSDAEIYAIVKSRPAEIACQELVDLGIARGTNDNLSVQVVTINEIDRETASHQPIDVTLWERVAGIFGSARSKR